LELKCNKPSEKLRKAFFNEELNWHSRQDCWVGEDEKGVVRAILRRLPVKEETVDSFTQWWQESRDLGCDMLLPLIKCEETQKDWYQEDESFWLCYQPCDGTFRDKDFTLEQGCLLAQSLARLHTCCSKLPAKNGSKSVAHWVRILQQRLAELLLYRGILRRRGCRTDFEGLFMENFDTQYRRGQEALNRLVIALQSSGNIHAKSWALGGLSKEEVFWVDKKPCFLGILPYSSFEMMDLCLLLKTGLSECGKDVGVLQCLLNAYQTEKSLTWEDCQMLQAQWFFPERFWCHARCYFLHKECQEAENCFDRLGLCLIEDNEIQELLEEVVRW